jgi:hypothetical protein
MTPPGKGSTMLYLNGKDAKKAGLSNHASPALWHGLAHGRLAGHVHRENERSGLYWASCAHCGWSGSEKHSLTLAQEDGAAHAESCEAARK